MNDEALKALVTLAVKFSQQHEDMTPEQRVKLFRQLVKAYLEETKK